MHTRIKICGITSPQDAIKTAALGADAIGLNFCPTSPRFVTIPQAQAILKEIPPFVTTVGVFVNATQEEISRVLAQLSLDLLQFHGDETPEFCQLMNKPYIKAIRMDQRINLVQKCEQYQTARALLLDTYQQGLHGGTGKTFNWDLIPVNLNKPIILAGGLNPENVAAAISKVHPYGVDVAGGVESEKGKKDPAKLRAFIESVRHAEQN